MFLPFTLFKALSTLEFRASALGRRTVCLQSGFGCTLDEVPEDKLAVRPSKGSAPYVRLTSVFASKSFARFKQKF